MDASARNKPLTRSFVKKHERRPMSISQNQVVILPHTTASSYRRQQNAPEQQLKCPENRREDGAGHPTAYHQSACLQHQSHLTDCGTKQKIPNDICANPSILKQASVADADTIVSLEEFSATCSSKTVDCIDNLFNCKELLGEGTYGMVYRSIRKKTGEVVALKNLRWESQDEGVPATCTREVFLLRELNHPNIVKLKEVIYETRGSTKRKKGPRLWLEFEYCEWDLRKYMKLFEKRRMPIETVRSITYQLLQGLAYCHKCRIIHRDIKPNNILLRFKAVNSSRKRPASNTIPRPSSQRRRTVAERKASNNDENQRCQNNNAQDQESSMIDDYDDHHDVADENNGDRGFSHDDEITMHDHRTGQEEDERSRSSAGSLRTQFQQLSKDHVDIKIADFGLARTIPFPLTPMTHEVVTLWYRAPEVLLGLPEYTTAVDIWSIGCCLIELLYGRPVFSGDTEIDTLFKIFRTLGTPNSSIWPNIEKFPHYQSVWPSWPRRPDRYDWLRQGEDIGIECKHLIDRLLCYDYRQRITCEEALQHPWFKPLHRP